MLDPAGDRLPEPADRRPAMRQILPALLALAVLSACTATIEPPKAKIVVPSVASSPGFCPPGQAKKGNC